MQFTYSFLVVCLVFVSACKGRSESTEALPARDLYGTYTFTADEATEQASCLFQFSKQKNDKGLYLPNGSSISLDGQNLTSDSIAIGEVYYELQLLPDQFTGDHVLLLKNETGKVFKEEIRISPVRLTSQIPEKLKRADLVFVLNGVNEYDKIQLGLIDTAFATNDFHLDTLTRSGRLAIAKSRLSAVMSGPLTIYLMVEKRIQPHDLKGEIIIRYIFRRETELVD